MWLYSLLNIGMKWGWVVNVTPRSFYPRELYTRLGGLLSWSGGFGKISLLPGFDPRTVHPVASRYTVSRPTPLLGTVLIMHAVRVRSHSSLQKATVNFVRCVCPCVCPRGKTWGFVGRIFVWPCIRNVLIKPVTICISVKLDKNKITICMEAMYVCYISPCTK
jgi:hypothetical protein